MEGIDHGQFRDIWGSNCKVHFFGHSLSKTDGEKIIEIEHLSSQMIVYYVDQEDYESKVINLIDIFGKDVVIEKIRIKKILFVEIEKAIYQ